MNPPVIFLLPSYDGRYDGLLNRGMAQCQAAGWLNEYDVWVSRGGSNIQRQREDGFHHWLTRTSFDWAVWVDSDTGFTAEDWGYLWDDDGSEAVCATYPAKKQSERRIVEFGFGFCRVSRRLMEEIDDLVHEDGRSTAARYRYGGEEYVEYCPQGARVIEGQWVAEDHGFWVMAKLTGAQIRLETRCRLKHVGQAIWYGGEEDPLRPMASDLTER